MVTQDHDHTHDDFEDEVEEPFIPAIVYDLQDLSESVPEGFNAVRIPLDGSIKSDLVWKMERSAAENFVKQGLRIFWDLDLGLFDRLKHPLDNQTQFLSLSLSVEHFRDTILKDFADTSVGLCLYRGSLRFDRVLKWNEKQEENFNEWLREVYGGQSPADSTEERSKALFSRDAAGQYLELLTCRLPDRLRCYSLMHLDHTTDPMLAAQLLTKDRYPKIIVGVRGGRNLEPEFGWDDSTGAMGYISRKLLATHETATSGICLPPMTKCTMADIEGIQRIVANFESKGIRYRIIPEPLLTSLWDGLDELYIPKGGVSAEGRRMLNGFIAAGGRVECGS